MFNLSHGRGRRIVTVSALTGALLVGGSGAALAAGSAPPAPSPAPGGAAPTTKAPSVTKKRDVRDARGHRDDRRDASEHRDDHRDAGGHRDRTVR